MIYKEENSYINESESISIGNKALYDLCKSYPMNDDVNGMIAKLWLIGRSYAASIERRYYGKDYSEPIDKKYKLNLNTGSNGTDSFFKKVSESIISDKDYEYIISKIKKLQDKKIDFNFNHDEEILSDICNLVIKFNRLIRRCIEQVDENALKEFENKNAKSKQDRNLINFISFSSKFIHFHLPNTVFIIDQFSSDHAKGAKDKDNNFTYSLKDNGNNIIFKVSKEKVKSFNTNYDNENEEAYVHHVERCYAIMNELHEQYKKNITPRMVDNFLLRVNATSNKKDKNNIKNPK